MKKIKYALFLFLWLFSFFSFSNASSITYEFHTWSFATTYATNRYRWNLFRIWQPTKLEKINVSTQNDCNEWAIRNQAWTLLTWWFASWTAWWKDIIFNYNFTTPQNIFIDSRWSSNPSDECNVSYDNSLTKAQFFSMVATWPVQLISRSYNQQTRSQWLANTTYYYHDIRTMTFDTPTNDPTYTSIYYNSNLISTQEAWSYYFAFNWVWTLSSWSNYITITWTTFNWSTVIQWLNTLNYTWLNFNIWTTYTPVISGWVFYILDPSINTYTWTTIILPVNIWNEGAFSWWVYSNFSSIISEIFYWNLRVIISVVLWLIVLITIFSFLRIRK